MEKNKELHLEQTLERLDSELIQVKAQSTAMRVVVDALMTELSDPAVLLPALEKALTQVREEMDSAHLDYELPPGWTRMRLRATRAQLLKWIDRCNSGRSKENP